MRRSSDANAPIVVSMVGAALVTAQFVAGKAARDAIYLGHLSAASLPSIVVATAVVSILLAFVSSRVLHWKAPAVVVPSAFVVSAALFMVEWALVELSPVAAARLLYLHVSGLGPMLGSGFWLIVTERFDPHTARQRFGEIAGAGTAGGLLGALAAERLGVLVGVSAMLPSLAAINLVCAWQIFSLARSGEVATHVREEEMAPELMVDSPQPGLRVLGGTPYLRQLAALVLLGSIAAAFVDYALKAQAGAAFASEAELLRFFAGFYAATSLITFVVQMSSSRIALEKFGLSFASSTPSLALFVGGLGALAAPGLAAAAIARAGEAVFRGSLFRSGYEVFYTPISPKQKRAAKSIIDVGFDRLGDAFGGSAIRAIQLLPLAIQYNTVVVFAVACSGLAMLVASRLSRGYVKTLEQSLLNRAVELELSDIEDTLTKTTVLRSLPSRTSSSVYGDTSVLPSASVTRELSRPGGERGADAAEPSPAPETRHGTELPGARAAAGGDGRHRASGTPDPELTDLVDLRSRDVERVRRVLRRDRGLPAFLVPQTIALLAWEPVAPDAIFALKKVAEERVGELIDALIDPNQPFAV
ncbi:MAG TPA: hypothetical protein VJP86_01665, partial [Vicinamibacterales bacterium]|nr:hypothetical protein [Vicinamibacterales bacterium]